MRGPHPLSEWLRRVLPPAGPEHLAETELLLAAVRAYQTHPHVRRMRAPPVAAQAGSVRLHRFAPSRKTGTSGAAVVLVPSLVNPSWVLDLEPRKSLARWLRDQGFDVHLVDWGIPQGDELDFDLDAYVARRLVPLIAQINRPVVLAGYCLGGTLSIAAACLAPQCVRALVALASPWVFSNYPAEHRAQLLRFWGGARQTADALGLLPMEVLQLAFWEIDDGSIARKFRNFAAMPPDSAAARRFVVMEDWANTGPPLTRNVALQSFDGMFGSDVTGNGDWAIDGVAIRPEALDCPALVVASSKDRLVPAASSRPLVQRLANATLIDPACGHVGMIVGSSAKRGLWRPMAEWINQLA